RAQPARRRRAGDPRSPDRETAAGIPRGRDPPGAGGALLSRDRRDHRRAHRHGHVAPGPGARADAPGVGPHLERFKGLGGAGKMNMDHTDFLDHADAYLDGETTPEDRRTIEAHLSACADCRAELDRRQTFSRRLKAGASYHEAPAGLARALAARL